jgi:hypothetical protein
MDRKYWAGIGSRETPNHVLYVMRNIGFTLAKEGWVLRSGHADGADLAFERGADLCAQAQASRPYKEIYLPWHGYNGGLEDPTGSNIVFTEQEHAIAAKYHPAWDRCSEGARKLHMRNTRILFGHDLTSADTLRPVRFIVCWTPNGEAVGGTGQALRIAADNDIPVFNLGHHDGDKVMLERLEQRLQAMLIETG